MSVSFNGSIITNIGSLSCTDGTFTGTVSGTNGTFTGTVSGNNGNFSTGTVTCGTVDCSGTVDSASGTFQRSGTNVLVNNGTDTIIYNTGSEILRIISTGTRVTLPTLSSRTIEAIPVGSAAAITFDSGTLANTSRFDMGNLPNATQASRYFTLAYNGARGVNIYMTSGDFTPNTNQLQHMGRSTARWNTTYAVTGNFTGTVSGSTATFTNYGTVSATTVSATTVSASGTVSGGTIDCSGTLDTATGTIQQSGNNILLYSNGNYTRLYNAFSGLIFAEGNSTGVTLYSNNGATAFVLTNSSFSLRDSGGTQKFTFNRTNGTFSPSTGGSCYDQMRWYYPPNTAYYWGMGDETTNPVGGNHYLYFFTNTSGTTRSCASIFNNRTTASIMNFTGQHPCIMHGFTANELNDKVGLIVSSNQNKYINENTAPGIDSITINESLPVVSISNTANDQSVFGVISSVEDESETIRHFGSGAFRSMIDKEEGEFRVFINSVGEGAMWVSNQNGSLVAGDYITTCTINGYGTKQSDSLLHNYTVAKITMNCDFAPASVTRKTIKKKTITKTIQEVGDVITEGTQTDYQWNETANRWEKITTTSSTTNQELLFDEVDVYDQQGNLLNEKHRVPRMITTNVEVNDLDEYGSIQYIDELDEFGNPIYEDEYQLRYIDNNGNVITETEYNAGTPGTDVFKAAFVGVTYHCG